MRRLDGLHFQYAFAGSQMLRDFLNCAGTLIGRRHARRDGVHANVPRSRLQGATTKKVVIGENHADRPIMRQAARVSVMIKCVSASRIGSL